MNKNNLIRFAQSLVFLPFMAGTMPLGNVLQNSVVNPGVRETVQTVFIQKENMEANGMIAFNRVIDQKAQEVEIKAEIQKLQAKKAKLIDAYLKERDMPLAGTGMKMVTEAEKNDLDWRLLPAIAIRESTGGKHACKKATNNSFGWGSCKISFSSNDKAIETLARNLGGNNPNTDHHYADKTTKQILQKYNPPSIIPHYAEQVMSIMNAIGSEELTLGETA